MTLQDPGGLFEDWLDDEAHNGTAALGLPIMHPEDVVGAVVRFANGQLSPGAGDDRRPVEKDRSLARTILAAAAIGRHVLEGVIATGALTSMVRQMATTPTVQIDGTGRRRVHWRVVGPPDTAPWVMLAAVMLLKDDAPEIGHCQLDRCGRFFFVARGRIGKPQTRYCSDEHRNEQHALGASERQKRSRQKRQDAKRKPRRSR